MKPFFPLCLGMLLALSGCVSREQSASEVYNTDDAGINGGQNVRIGASSVLHPARLAAPFGPTGRSGIGAEPIATGERGSTGERGDRGPQGERGALGDPGLRGEQGEKGEVGANGERGGPGERGEKGDVGVQGERGEKGDRGDRGEPGFSGKDRAQDALVGPAPIILPWLFGQRSSDSKRPVEPDKEDYFLIGLSGLVTALTPLLLAFFQKQKNEMDTDKPITDPAVIFYTCMQLVVLILGAWFIAYLALQFMQWLLIFVCVYTFIIAIAFVCYAYGRKLLADTTYRMKLAELDFKDREMRRVHAIRSLKLRVREAQWRAKF